MAGKNVKLTLALDKDKEFRDSLKACKDEVKRYKEDLKELTDGFKKNKASMEDLKKVQEDLKGKQEAFVKQLEAARTGQQKANEQYEKTNARLQELKEKLKAAEDAQDKLNAEGKEGTEEYKKATEEVEKYRKATEEQASIVAKAETNISKWNHEVKNAERGLESCEKDIEENAKEMDNLADQTDDASKSLDKFADDMEDADKQSGKFSVSISDMVKNKLIDLAGDALKGLGEKALDAAKYIVEVGSEFEAQMSKVEAISGASEEEVEKLRAAAEEMGRTTKFTATEAGEALEYMAMAGWKTDEMLDGLSGVMDLAAASGTDLGTTSDIVTDALTAFGKSAGESGRLADIMAAASSNANTNVEMMGETFKYAAPVAGALGYSMEDTAVAIGLMANAGIKASQAGTSIRTGLTRLVSPTKQAKEAMEAYGISVTDTDGNMLSFHDMMVQIREKLGGLDEAEQAAAASAIFGKQSMSGWLAVINASDEDFNNLTTSINNSDGAAKNMATTMQDNLQGKMTLFNSAMEGLGITLYNYFSGTLSEVVGFATGVINKISEVLTPQKTVLDEFIDDIAKANEQVQNSIQHAQDTVTNAETKVAELEGYKNEFSDILGQCDQFNQITLANGEKAIVDASGNIVTKIGEVGTEATDVDGILEQFANDGFKTDGIKGSSDSAQEMIGYVETKAIDAKAAIEGIGSESVAAGISSAVASMGDLDVATQNVYHITDEFTKVKITHMVETLGDSVGGLADAWNAETGELTASKEQLEAWFDTAKEVAMYSALQDAVKELYDAWGQASVNVVKATSASKQALDEYNEAAGTSFKTASEALDHYKNQWGFTSVELESAYIRLEQTQTAVDDANKSVDEAGEQIELYGEALKDAKPIMEDTNENIEGTGTSADTAKTALEQLEEQEEENTEAAEGLTDAQLNAIKAFQEMSGSTIEDLKKIQEQLQMSDEDFAEWCQSRVDEVQPIIDEYNGLVENIKSSMQSFVQGLDTSGEEGSKAIDNIISNLESRNKDLETWVENMKYLGQMAGKELPQALYDELVAGGPEKTKDAVQELVNAAESKTGDFERVATEYEKGLELQSSAETLASYTSVGKKYEEAIKNGFVGSLEDYQKTVADGTQSAADAGKAKAEETGAEAGETLAEKEAEGAKSKSDVVEDASEAVIESAQQAAMVASDTFKEVGKTAILALSGGMNMEADKVTTRAQKILEDLQTELDKSKSMAYGIGKDLITALKNGIDEMAYEPENAIHNLLDEIRTEAENSGTMMYTAGSDAAAQFAYGLDSQSYGAANAGGNLASVAQNAASSWNNAFYNTGYYMSAGLADGIYSGRSRAMDAAAAVARSALNTVRNILGVRSPSKEFEKIGEFLDEGLAKGLQENIGQVTSSAQNAAYEAMKAAKTALNDGSFETSMSMVNSISMDSMRTLESIGNVGAGVSDVGGIINAMRNDLLGSLANFQSAMTAQGAQRQHVVLQVGDQAFDAYLVSTASNGLSMLSHNSQKGVGA